MVIGSKISKFLCSRKECFMNIRWCIFQRGKNEVLHCLNSICQAFVFLEGSYSLEMFFLSKKMLFHVPIQLNRNLISRFLWTHDSHVSINSDILINTSRLMIRRMIPRGLLFRLLRHMLNQEVIRSYRSVMIPDDVRVHKLHAVSCIS